ncbi:hypothetical protein HFN89_01645 [Rhizobium laguerreae]|nr:hypothetical protein [Rhizobium laguerreae]
MKCDVHSKALNRHVFSLLGPGLETSLLRARNEAILCSIDPEDLDVQEAADPDVSAELDRFGVEWFVDSEAVQAVAPRRI